MPLVIDGLSVLVSNSSASQLGSVRIKSPTGKLLALVKLQKSEPLVWITKHPDSEEALALREQLLKRKVSKATVENVLKQRPSRYEMSKLMRTAK